jgi:PAS domain S-box-containing protein
MQDVIAGGRKLDPSAPLTLEAGTKSLEFRYAAINLTAPEKVHYQYRLEGFDKEWVDAGTRRHASYTNLRPGKYRFQVRAASDDGPWSTATASIRQRAFFYQTPWFLSALALVFIGTIAGAHRTRVKLVRASAERFKQLFDRNPAGEFRANETGGILDCNDACARLFGFGSRAELMASGIADRFVVETTWQSMLGRLRDHGTISSFETAVRRPDETRAPSGSAATCSTRCVGVPSTANVPGRLRKLRSRPVWPRSTTSSPSSVTSSPLNPDARCSTRRPGTAARCGYCAAVRSGPSIGPERMPPLMNREASRR